MSALAARDNLARKRLPALAKHLFPPLFLAPVTGAYGRRAGQAGRAGWLGNYVLGGRWRGLVHSARVLWAVWVPLGACTCMCGRPPLLVVVSSARSPWVSADWQADTRGKAPEGRPGCPQLPVSQCAQCSSRAGQRNTTQPRHQGARHARAGCFVCLRKLDRAAPSVAKRQDRQFRDSVFGAAVAQAFFCHRVFFFGPLCALSQMVRSG